MGSGMSKVLGGLGGTGPFCFIGGCHCGALNASISTVPFSPPFKLQALEGNSPHPL